MLHFLCKNSLLLCSFVFLQFPRGGKISSPLHLGISGNGGGGATVSLGECHRILITFHIRGWTKKTAPTNNSISLSTVQFISLNHSYDPNLNSTALRPIHLRRRTKNDWWVSCRPQLSTLVVVVALLFARPMIYTIKHLIMCCNYHNNYCPSLQSNRLIAREDCNTINELRDNRIRIVSRSANEWELSVDQQRVYIGFQPLLYNTIRLGTTTRQSGDRWRSVVATGVELSSNSGQLRWWLFDNNYNY